MMSGDNYPQERKEVKKCKNEFNPQSLELVEFKKSNSSSKYLYFPLQFFAASDFLKDMLEKALISSNGSNFKDRSDDTEFRWLLNKVEEWKRHYKGEQLTTGAFWNNIQDHYYGDLDIPKWDSYQADHAICIDSYSGINKVLSMIKKKEKKEIHVSDEDEMDRLLASLDGDPLVSDYSLATNQAGISTDISSAVTTGDFSANEVHIAGDLKLGGSLLVYDGTEWVETTIKGKNMKMENVKNTVVAEVKELVNQSGAADIALGRMLYNNIKATAGRTVVKISFVDKALATVSKKMKYKNEMTELLGVLTLMVVLKQFYDHKALENVRGYIVNRLYTIGIEATGFDDVLALIKQTESTVETV